MIEYYSFYRIKIVFKITAQAITPELFYLSVILDSI